MKQIFTDPVKSVEVMERMQLCHDLLTELRKQMNIIEKEFFSLVGEEFGDLTVLSAAGGIKVINNQEHYVPAWRCHCTCGETIIVDHDDLLSNKQTNCGECKK